MDSIAFVVLAFCLASFLLIPCVQGKPSFREKGLQFLEPAIADDSLLVGPCYLCQSSTNS